MKKRFTKLLHNRKIRSFESTAGDKQIYSEILISNEISPEPHFVSCFVSSKWVILFFSFSIISLLE